MIGYPAPPHPLGGPAAPDDPAVRAELHIHYGRKCFLTEVEVPRSEMELDHRHPKGDGGTDTWGNLVPVHRKANAHRQRTWPDGGLLMPWDDVEGRLCQRLETGVGPRVKAVFEAIDADDVAAVNTADELRRLHQDVPWADDLLADLHARLTLLQQDVIAFLEASGDGDAEVVAQQRGLIRLRLSRQSPFTALLRSRFGRYAALFD